MRCLEDFQQFDFKYQGVEWRDGCVCVAFVICQFLWDSQFLFRIYWYQSQCFNLVRDYVINWEFSGFIMSNGVVKYGVVDQFIGVMNMNVVGMCWNCVFILVDYVELQVRFGVIYIFFFGVFFQVFYIFSSYCLEMLMMNGIGVFVDFMQCVMYYINWNSWMFVFQCIGNICNQCFWQQFFQVRFIQLLFYL